MIKQFSEDEEDADQPLAPLADVDDVEVIEDDEQEEAATGENSRAASEIAVAPSKDSEAPSKAPSPKPHPLSVSFQPPSPPALPIESIEPTLGDDDAPELPTATLDVTEHLIPDHIMNIDMSQLGPDGETFGEGDSLLQVQEGDAILGGGELMDQTGDPFAPPPA